MSTMRVDNILSSGGTNTATINGITPAIASQAEAEAGTDNTKLMTSQRVRENVLKAGVVWEPYDGATGRIWSFAVDGAVTTITTPDFVDGWEYAFQFERLQTSSGSSTSFNINLFRETAGAYAGASALVASGFSTTLMLNGYAELLNPRLVRSHHVAQGFFAVNTIANALGGFAVGSGGAAHGTAQKILRAQFSCGLGNITGTGAAIYMLRRRNVGA